MLGGRRQSEGGDRQVGIIDIFIGAVIWDRRIEDRVVVDVALALPGRHNAVGILEPHALNEELGVPRVRFIVDALGIHSDDPIEHAHLLVAVVTFAQSALHL